MFDPIPFAFTVCFNKLNLLRSANANDFPAAFSFVRTRRDLCFCMSQLPCFQPSWAEAMKNSCRLWSLVRLNHDFVKGAKIKTHVPERFWDIAPKDAALALVRENCPTELRQAFEFHL